MSTIRRFLTPHLFLTVQAEGTRGEARQLTVISLQWDRQWLFAQAGRQSESLKPVIEIDGHESCRGEMLELAVYGIEKDIRTQTIVVTTQRDSLGFVLIKHHCACHH
jgi:hypothetical protein